MRATLIGQILWVAKQTRPDVIFDNCSLTSNIKNATVQSIHEVNKVIYRVKSEKVTLKCQHLGNSDDLSLVVFINASLVLMGKVFSTVLAI